MPELLLRKALCEAGIKGYRLNWKKAPGSPDIAFVGKKIAIFVNGCFWHRCPKCNRSIPKTNREYWMKKFDRTVERDSLNLGKLQELGWKALTIWECEIKKDLDSQVSKIKKNYFVLNCSLYLF